MPNEVKLLPCPFCGKVPLIVCPDNSYGSALITCGDGNECEVGPTAWADLPHESLEIAANRWNTRPTIVTDEVVERVKAAINSARRVRTNPERPDNDDEYAEKLARAAIAAMPAIVGGE